MNLDVLCSVFAIIRAHLAEFRSDERGLTEYVILLFVLAAAALLVGGIITSKVVSKANSIPMN